MTSEIDSLTLRTLKDIRREQIEQRSLLLGAIDQGRRIERRVSELRDELELTIRMELMGRLANFETHVDEKIARELGRAEATDV